MSNVLDRRQYLTGLGIAPAPGLAGCTGGNGDTDGERQWALPGGYADLGPLVDIRTDYLEQTSFDEPPRTWPELIQLGQEMQEKELRRNGRAPPLWGLRLPERTPRHIPSKAINERIGIITMHSGEIPH